jgi:hypothetical protein
LRQQEQKDEESIRQRSDRLAEDGGYSGSTDQGRLFHNTQYPQIAPAIDA